MAQPLDGAAHRSYRELYSFEGFQAGEPDPARLIYSYRFNETAGGGERPAPAHLIEQTMALSERRSMAFLCLVRNSGTTTEVRILNRMIRYLELPGVGGGGLVDLSMGLLGDVRASQIPAVAIDNTHFSLVGNAGVRIPTIATMLDHLDAAPPGTYIGPFTADAPGTEVVRPRITQVIPVKYASALVHRDGIEPAVAYQEIFGMLEADGLLETCADVLTWLRVACTARGGDGELANVPAVAHHFPLLLLPEAASEYLATKVTNDLPGRQNPGIRGRGQGTPADDPMLAAVRQIAESGAGDRGARAPRKVEEVYRETYTVLQRFCHVDNVEGFAPIWGRLARGAKSELQSIVQQELSRVCTGRGLLTDYYCPAVTSNVKQLTTAGLNFGGHGQDGITAGCQPFLVVYSGTEGHYRSLDTATLANQLDQGTANASLADIREIRDKERLNMPQDLNHVSYTLRRYAVLVHTLFQGPGATNAFVECIWRLANTFNDRLPAYLSEHQKLRGTAWYDVYPAHIVQHVQVNVYEYLQGVQSSMGRDLPPLPSFQELHRCLQRGSFPSSSEWLPLPPTITVEPASHAVTSVGMATVAARSARAAAASNASVLSGLTATTTSDATQSTGPGQSATNAGTYALKPARDTEFEAIRLRPGMRQLLQENPPPRNDRNVEFCVSWWGRGGCYTNCRRAVAHRPFANAAERDRLLSHIRTHLTAAAAPAAST